MVLAPSVPVTEAYVTLRVCCMFRTDWSTIHLPHPALRLSQQIPFAWQEWFLH
jgi:hypothetical protein